MRIHCSSHRCAVLPHLAVRHCNRKNHKVIGHGRIGRRGRGRSCRERGNRGSVVPSGIRGIRARMHAQQNL